MLTTKKFILVYVVMLLAMLYMHVHADTAVPINKPFAQFPTEHQGWRQVDEYQFSEVVLNMLRPTDILNRVYARPGERPIDLHVGFYDGGKGTGSSHSPKHCLPGSGWFLISSERKTLEVGGENLNLVQAVYQFGENKELFIYWFQMRDKTMNSEYVFKLSRVLSSMMHRRQDTAFIRISTRFEGESEAVMDRTMAFVEDFYPVIREFLPS